MLTPAEKRQVLVEWNETAMPFPREKCVHQLFEEQVQQRPDAVAVIHEDAQLTYRELNERAEMIAQELRTLGVGPDVRVGICVKRSFEMISGLLGILKAGGCYVPLDPTYPRERIAFMIEDAQVPVLLTQDRLQSEFKFEVPGLKLLCLDAPRFAGRLTGAATPRISAGEDAVVHSEPHHLAYVMYTSGSTGKPKGVMVTHRNVVNFFTGMDQILGTTRGVWLAVTSISFDISVLELFWTLARGFQVIIQSDDDRVMASRPTGGDEHTAGQRRTVPEQFARHNITHLQCTPSLAGTLLPALGSLPATRRPGKFLLGGEALPLSLAQQLNQLIPGGLINMYGPTETTVWSASHRVGDESASVPIGKPLANTQIYVLDRGMQPAPAGVPGEIFIGGQGVTRGYLNRPELTAERFVQNPFSTDPEARMYRTGDLGKWRADGVLEFLGRLDNQVKIRGHRIELPEIEAFLARQPGVREAVVIAREDVPGDKRLVAYIVAAPDGRTEARELRRATQEALPSAMVPSAFVFLTALPLTPNGKVNRRALSPPEARRAAPDSTFVAPRTSLEKAIAGVWVELLRVEQVGLHDNFFELGGHSLLAVQAQSRLQVLLKVDLPVVKIFQFPTISALAGFLNGGETASTSVSKARDRGERKQAAAAKRTRREHGVMA